MAAYNVGASFFYLRAESRLLSAGHDDLAELLHESWPTPEIAPASHGKVIEAIA
jgi:hypothetical protein